MDFSLETKSSKYCDSWKGDDNEQDANLGGTPILLTK